MAVQDNGYTNGRDVHGGPELFEAYGNIKWFDPAKGYGFIVPDNGLPDIFLHVSCLRAGGFETVFEGARVSCRVWRDHGRLKADKILRMETPTVGFSHTKEKAHPCVHPESEWEYGEVKWFSRVRGFGFITLEDDRTDVFVHMETVRACGFVELRSQQIVQVRWGTSAKGRTVAEIKSAGEE